ncbi:MAG: NADH-quinone oxidoreductase subunit L, partial [Gallionella sp.]|nr:NADH-quinone oxidoreductase subunit L [Gallionella sp.]
MMDIQTLYLLVPLAPLLGAILAGLFGNWLGRKWSHRVTIALVGVSLYASMRIFMSVLDGHVFDGPVYTWLTSGGTSFHVGFLIDRLTVTMMLVVTSVSLMVHIYTIGYMQEDPGYQRFFSYISLFTFSMLMLVMANNFMQLFFGWEAVGLVSYLLIGFWYTRPTAIYANLKAFLVNRVGDFGFLLGIALVLMVFGSLNYADVFANVAKHANDIAPIGSLHVNLITAICVLLFIGAMGKSAQFPLHVWLPDSMEGPTPISALIHAATMVTAGIFMVARMSPMFEFSEAALSFVMIIGAITALFMGFLGIIQNDIKRVIAYSTLSQLGYMTVALGASAYSAAIFHLMTHAFFKALLFLAAGSVIIAMHHDQDIRNMGGLRKYMPITWITSLIGSLALIGTPFFSGFYSKDSIIEAVEYSHLPGHTIAYIAVVAGVFVTAFYSFRMYFLVFHGAERFGKEHHATGSRHTDAAAAPAHADAALAGGDGEHVGDHYDAGGS